MKAGPPRGLRAWGFKPRPCMEPGCENRAVGAGTRCGACFDKQQRAYNQAQPAATLARRGARAGEE